MGSIRSLTDHTCRCNQRCRTQQSPTAHAEDTPVRPGGPRPPYRDNLRASRLPARAPAFSITCRNLRPATHSERFGQLLAWALDCSTDVLALRRVRRGLWNGIPECRDHPRRRGREWWSPAVTRSGSSPHPFGAVFKPFADPVPRVVERALLRRLHFPAELLQSSVGGPLLTGCGFH